MVVTAIWGVGQRDRRNRFSFSPARTNNVQLCPNSETEKCLADIYFLRGDYLLLSERKYIYVQTLSGGMIQYLKDLGLLDENAPSIYQEMNEDSNPLIVIYKCD